VKGPPGSGEGGSGFFNSWTEGEPLGLREEAGAWTPGSEGGGLGPGPLGLREEAGAWTPGSEGGGWGLDPWV
jgi:hypothetical protein